MCARSLYPSRRRHANACFENSRMLQPPFFLRLLFFASALEFCTSGSELLVFFSCCVCVWIRVEELFHVLLCWAFIVLIFFYVLWGRDIWRYRLYVEAWYCVFILFIHVSIIHAWTFSLIIVKSYRLILRIINNLNTKHHNK